MKLLSVLAAFDTDHRRLRLTDVAERAGLPIATAHRMVTELSEWDALTRLPDGSYVIGQRLWRTGMLAPQPHALREAALPFINDLYAAASVTVHLAVREGDRALYIERLSGPHTVRVLSEPGARLPMHATGVGKVLLAYAPADVERSVLTSLWRLTPHTVVQPGRLRRQLEALRRDGYVTTHEEMQLGACSVAVPVRDGEDRVVASLGAVVPNLRGSSRLITALQVAAGGIQRALVQGTHLGTRTPPRREPEER